jgi:SAM-dependent methyltransferase
MVFDHYAKYYNLLYEDKNYEGEVNYIHSLILRFTSHSATNVLDIGCGTGTHASFLSQLGYRVTGVDLSQEMIDQALAKQIPNTDFQVGNAVDFKLPGKFEVITSLFHVLSYQTTNENAQKMIANVANHLSGSGIFVFDFWYAPAVLTERPSVKIKRLEDGDIKITRIAEPVLKVNENTVEVNFELLIENKYNQQLTVIKEVHPMRYFSLPEIELLLTNTGMKLLYAQEWLTEKMPSDHTWGVCCVAGKKEFIKK